MGVVWGWSCRCPRRQLRRFGCQSLRAYEADLLAVFWLHQLMMCHCSCHSWSQAIAAHVRLIEVSTEHDLQPQVAGLCARKAVIVCVRTRARVSFFL